MQLLDWLELRQLKVTDLARSLGIPTPTVWRHAHGKRRPEPEAIQRYEEETKGAVGAADWHELALRTSTKERAA